MITKMKKLTFLVYHKEYEEFLNSLRELGVVHIVEKQQGAADNTELQENIRLSNRLAATLKLLQNQKHEKNAVIATEGGTAAVVYKCWTKWMPCKQSMESCRSSCKAMPKRKKRWKPGVTLNRIMFRS